MNRILFSTLCCLLFAGQALAQQALSGTVLAADNTPITGATVVATGPTGSDSGTISDADGSFSMNLSEAGDYRLNISYIGYETFTKNVTVNYGNQTDVGSIILTEASQILQSVEVVGRRRKDYNSDYSFSGSKVAMLNKELPQAVSTVTKELLSDRQAFQLVDAVRTVSNVAPTGIYNHYNIRGITQADDGQVVNGLRTRQYYFLQPITAHLERVEVIKGPSSVTFSSADPGGTVNMVTKKPLREKRGEVSFATGSFSTLRSTIDFTGPLNEEKTLLYRLNGAYQQAKSFRDVVNNNAILIMPSFSYVPNESTALNVEMIYSDNDGNLDRGQPIFGAFNGNFDINSTPISLNVGASSDSYKTREITFTTSFTKRFTDNFGFNAQYMKQTWEEDLAEHRVGVSIVDIEGNVIPTAVRLRYDERQQFWETDNVSVYLDYNIESGNVTNKILLGYDATRWERSIGAGFLRARRYQTISGAQANFNPANADNFLTTTFNGTTIPLPSAAFLDLENPFNGARNTDDYNLATLSIPANLNTSNGFYVQNQFKVGKFSALLNLRYETFTDIFNYEKDEQEFETSAFVPRLGLTYEVTPNISAYATYLEGFQPHTNTVSLSPTAEGFFWAASPARFDPLESSLTEFGLKAEFMNGRVFANFAIFDIVQKNILLGDTYDLDNLTTRGEQRSRGFEMDVSGYVTPDLQLVFSYGYNDAEIVEDAIESFIGERLGGAPQHNANFWGRYDFANNSFLRGTGFGLGAQYVAERFTWYNPTYATDRVLLPSYTVFEAAVYYKPSATNMQLT
ncbi:MAG: TonB-dependent receptor, partial [Bacteroidota bacterium]